MRSCYLRPLLLFLAACLACIGAVRGADDEGGSPTSSSDTHGADAVPTKPVGRMITLSDFGAEDLAYLSVPTTPPTLGIVLVPDAYGLDDFTKSEADRLAALGYLALAVDIYNGKLTTDPGDLANLVANLNAATVMKTVDAGVRVFRESPKFRVRPRRGHGLGRGRDLRLPGCAREQEHRRRDHLLRAAHHLRPPDRQVRRAALRRLIPRTILVATHTWCSISSSG